MSNEFTTDTTQWAIADEDVYVENPEFVYVNTDREGKILWAIKIDGSIYYGAGIPQQVKDYIEEKIAELPLDEYEDIVTFLGDYLGSDTTLKVMIDSINDTVNAKVDSIGEWVDNPEFARAITDTNNKVIDYTDKNGRRWIHDLHADNIPENISEMEDVEGRISISCDKDEKIISYRDSNGRLHE